MSVCIYGYIHTATLYSGGTSCVPLNLFLRLTFVYLLIVGVAGYCCT